MKSKKQGENQKRSKKIYILPGIIFLIGLGVMLYPVFTDWMYQLNVKSQTEAYEEKMQTNPKLEELYQELQRRNVALYEEKQRNLVDPWSYEQSSIDLTEYGIEDNIIGFIEIDKMDIELPILLGANSVNMSEGAGHLTETSYPIGGENTNCVLAAHRGYMYAKMFRDIELLELGDEILIKNFREDLVYEVAEIQVIKPTEVDKLLIQEGRDLVTLITCHPYRHNYQRYVVICERQVGETNEDSK